MPVASTRLEPGHGGPGKAKSPKSPSSMIYISLEREKSLEYEYAVKKSATGGTFYVIENLTK